MTPDQLAKSGTEHGEQRALFAWANMARLFGIRAAFDDRCYTEPGYAMATYKREYGESRLKWLHAIHNQGHGDAIRGAKAKAEGVKAGVLDVFLPQPMAAHLLDYRDWPGVYPVASDQAPASTTAVLCGLYIEMKRKGKGKATSDKQKEFIADVGPIGYAVCVCDNWRAAADRICLYLGLKR